MDRRREERGREGGRGEGVQRKGERRVNQGIEEGEIDILDRASQKRVHGVDPILHFLVFGLQQHPTILGTDRERVLKPQFSDATPTHMYDHTHSPQSF